MLSDEEKFSLNPIKVTILNGAALVDIRHQDYENSEYFSFKRLMNKSYFQDRSFLTKFVKTRFKFFNRPSPNDFSPFEKLLVSNEDKSAIISLLIRSFNLWNNADFWTKMVNLEEIMKHYAINRDANVKNLFSILIYDWHCPKDESTNYCLSEKFEAYALSGESLFTKLYSIIDSEDHQGYNRICLRIIYQYLHERLNTIENFYEKTLFQDIITHTVSDALKIQNEEYKIQILKILTVFLDNTGDDIYKHLKEQISESVNYKFECHSVYRISLDAIEKHCDEKFFKIAFLLKENRLKRFEFEFEDFIKTYQKYYGEYWKVAIKPNARLLYHICEEQCEKKLLKTVEFIFHKCPFIELNSTILTTFEEVADFEAIFNEPLSKCEEELLENVYKFFEKDFIQCMDEFKKQSLHNKKMTRKLLFGRKSVYEKSLLEEILSQPRLYSILGDIWKKFHLYSKPELLTLKNHMGKPLIQHAFEAGVNQMVAFLNLPMNHKTEDFNRPKYYMVMQNSQIYSLTEKSLLEYQIDIFLGMEELELGVDLFVRNIYLLEEIGTIDEIQSDEVIDYFLKLMEKTDQYAHELFEIDDLLGIMIIYWTPYKGQYEYYKQKMIQINSFFDILFMTIEKKYDEFLDSFSSKFDELEDVYETRYDVSVTQRDTEDHLYELYSSNFMFILFLAAIRTNQHKLIDFIFKNDWFVTINFGFPENVKTSEIHYYAALNLLKHRHELGRANIPEDWLTHEVLDDFLDSRISYRDKDYIEIDCTSLLHAESQKIKVRGPTDVTDKLLMLEDTMSLSYIRDHENLKNLIAHPVIETYINLKSHKYQRIFVYNFWAFVLLYIMPFIALISHNHGVNSDSVIWTVFMSNRFHYIGIIFLILRESFQCIISGSIISYLKQRSNIFDMILITLSIALSLCSNFKSENIVDISSSSMAFLEVALILFTTISATSLIPLAYVPINMQILKKVSLTFLNIFYTFAIILIAFSFSFCIMFEDPCSNANSTINCSEQAPKEENSGEEDGDDDPIDNFKYPHTALMKIMTMLSGEYSIEPIKLSPYQLAFFAVFVTTSFILFNLILGLSIEDVQELKNGSRLFNLLTQTKKLINVGQKLDIYYNFIVDYYDNRYLSQSKLDVFKDVLLNISTTIVRFSLSKYIHAHSIQKIYVNIKSREVFINVNRKYEPILKTTGYRNNDRYIINETTLTEIQQIINVKNKKMFKNLKKTMQTED
ncbi:hypothetical protein ACKWTF_005204 [Chironomus riparius]